MTGDDDAPQGAFASLLDSAGNILARFLGNALQAFTSADVRYPFRGFGNWYDPAADRGDNRPTTVTVDATVYGQNGNAGSVLLHVDDDGDDANDAKFAVAATRASGLTTNPDMMAEGSVTVPIPAGGQYKIVNQADPTGNNAIQDVREVAK